jgi:hypothetical protein
VDLRLLGFRRSPERIEPCPGEDQEAAKVVVVEILDGVEEIAVEGHLMPLRAGRRA